MNVKRRIRYMRKAWTALILMSVVFSIGFLVINQYVAQNFIWCTDGAEQTDIPRYPPLVPGVFSTTCARYGFWWFVVFIMGIMRPLTFMAYSWAFTSVALNGIEGLPFTAIGCVFGFYAILDVVVTGFMIAWTYMTGKCETVPFCAGYPDLSHPTTSWLVLTWSGIAFLVGLIIMLIISGGISKTLLNAPYERF